jgi:hypothetical protein
MPVGDLDAPLLQLTPWDHFTLRDAVQGVATFGGTGSGKTSGSAQALAKAYLSAGFGGVVLCAKPEEAELWRRYCMETGRWDSLVEWDGTNGGFNFLSYEISRQGVEGINSVVELIMRVFEISRNASALPSRPGESFWDDTMRQVLRNSIPILYAAFGTVRIADILQFLRTAPRSADEMSDPRWRQGSFFCHCFAQAAPHIQDDLGDRIVTYWRNDFAGLDPKTRGNIVITMTTALDRFNNGWLKDAFCGETTFAPELTLNGIVILLNMPALTRNEDGIIAQQLFKYMWQRAVLARNGLPPQFQQRPVFLWADEAQYFVNSFDAEYLSTCRGSRACTVFISQSLPTYYAKMGGDNAHDRVHHLLGNFGTKIWHNLGGCAETAEWAAKTLGRKLHVRQNWSEGHGQNHSTGMNMGEGENWGQSSQSGGSSSYSKQGSSSGSSWSSGNSSGGSDNRGRNHGYGTSSNSSHGYSEQMDWVLEPGAFSRGLMTGGPANRNRVSAIWYQAGRSFNATHSNAMLAEFQQ